MAVVLESHLARDALFISLASHSERFRRMLATVWYLNGNGNLARTVAATAMDLSDLLWGVHGMTLFHGITKISLENVIPWNQFLRCARSPWNSVIPWKLFHGITHVLVWFHWISMESHNANVVPWNRSWFNVWFLGTVCGQNTLKSKWIILQTLWPSVGLEHQRSNKGKSNRNYETDHCRSPVTKESHAAQELAWWANKINNRNKVWWAPQYHIFQHLFWKLKPSQLKSPAPFQQATTWTYNNIKCNLQLQDTC